MIMVSHVKTMGLRQRQKPIQGNPSLLERELEWRRRAIEYRELAAIPSTIFETEFVWDEVDNFEDIFKGSMARKTASFMKPGIKICDVGCGPARFAQHIVPMMREFGGTYLGIDQSQEILDLAFHRMRSKNLYDSRDTFFVKGLATHISKYGPFDLIVNGQNLIHIVDDSELEDLIEDHCLSLSPDGKIFVYAPFLEDNRQYEKTEENEEGPVKNRFTYIRTIQAVNKLFAVHHIIPTDAGTLNPYFPIEVYRSIFYKKVDQCPLD